MIEKRTRPTLMWVVAHPQLPHKAYVLADNWELATVAAAKYWGVPWPQAASGCYEVEHHKAQRNVCIRCGKIVYGDTDLCDRCRSVMEGERIVDRRAMARSARRRDIEWKERKKA